MPIERPNRLLWSYLCEAILGAATVREERSNRFLRTTSASSNVGQLHHLPDANGYDDAKRAQVHFDEPAKRGAPLRRRLAGWSCRRRLASKRVARGNQAGGFNIG